MCRAWFRLYLAKLCRRNKHCTTALLMKVPSLKVGTYLKLEFHNILFTNPTYLSVDKSLFPRGFS